MDFRDTPEEARFRAEASDWIERTLEPVPALEGLTQEEREHWGRWWQERLSEGGWIGLTWPKEYGGRELPVVYQAIFNEESARRKAPHPINTAGTTLAGPTILAHGTEEQKARLLPEILASREYWCQGFSEPGSGSDLASLSARAERVPGGWSVTGQKVWTSYAHQADRCMLLVRTDPDAPRHQGITYLLADMSQARVRPLVMINGDAEFNEVFFDELFVPDSDVLGPVGGGWEVALTTLAFERGGIALNLWVWARQALDALLDTAEAAGALDDPSLADSVGEFEAAVEAIRIGSIRTMSTISAGERPGEETSAIKLQWAAAMQDITRETVRLAGSSGVLTDDGAGAGLHAYFRSRANTIEGGTDEIQKSIIAERVLGLARSR